MPRIIFEVEIADSFHYPKNNNNIDNTHIWPIGSLDREELNVDLEFESITGNNMKDAENALDVYIKENYPNKEYKIHYWWWK